MTLHDESMKRLGRPNMPDLEQRVRELQAEVAQARAERDEARLNVEGLRRSLYATEESSAKQYQRAEAAEATIATLRAERDEARTALDAWVKWVSTSRCIYCGQEFAHNPHDQKAADEPKKAHILVCEAHPLRAALAEIATLRAALTAAQAWQPIDTAPRDGTAILLTDGTYIRTGWWASRRNAWSVDTIVQLPMPTQWAALPAIAQPAPAQGGEA